MCGIWGYVGSTESVTVGNAWGGMCALTDRGPDDWGMYLDGEGKVVDEEHLPADEREVVLGNRRLSILDLSAAGNQPMESNGRWIVYNGEVYNYRELREELRERGYEFESDTDTEVILYAFEEFGQDVVERLRGMFAFAIYDETTGELFAARDRFGIKPFYFDVSSERLAFASEVTSLLESDVSRPRLDPVSVDGYLALGYVPAPRTIVEGIRSLPAGSTLTYDRRSGELETERYWSPEFDETESGDPEHMRELLLESVDLRLRSDVPVGAFLSGGLDSSTIVALMREAAEQDREDLHTFSIGFEREAYSETGFAEAVAEEFGTRHVSRTVEASDVRDELDAIIDAMDQPTIDGVNTYFVSQVAAQNDLKVVLSGLGSDEFFGGYPTFESTARRYRLAKRLYDVPPAVRAPVADLADWLGRRSSNDLLGKVGDAVRSTAPFGAAYMSARGLFSTGQRRQLLDERPESWDEAIEEEVERTATEGDVRNAVSHAEATWYMRNQLLRDTDAMSMSHSLEVRVPFLDSVLTDYLSKVEPDAKYVGEKGLLKQAMADDVPIEVIERRKSGFKFPFADWLRNELRDVVDDTFDDELFRGRPVSPEAAFAVRDAFYRGDVHWSRLWALVVLARWCDQHLE